jgi:hypothetical protein
VDIEKEEDDMTNGERAEAFLRPILDEGGGSGDKELDDDTVTELEMQFDAVENETRAKLAALIDTELEKDIWYGAAEEGKVALSLLREHLTGTTMRDQDSLLVGYLSGTLSESDAASIAEVIDRKSPMLAGRFLYRLDEIKKQKSGRNGHESSALRILRAALDEILEWIVSESSSPSEPAATICLEAKVEFEKRWGLR